jgi:hypothetical protein
MIMQPIKPVLYFNALISLLCFYNCSPEKDISDGQINIALESAGKNEIELKKVINHYRINAADSLKLKATYFLIANMPGKGFEEYELRDSVGNKVNIDLFVFKNPDSLEQYKNNYESKYRTKIKFVRTGFKEDIKNITADLLIENIEYAFKAWQLPWTKHLNFTQFCELILPYRIGNEPLQNWRKRFFEKNIWIRDSIQSKEDILKACSVINDHLKSKYDYRHGALDFYPGMLTVEEVEKFGGGRCEDLNMYAGYCMRSMGIPIALEFTPYWANSNYGGHSWLGVLNYTGQFVPFNAVYDNPISDSLPFAGAKLAKAYRVSFKQLQPLIIANDSIALPPFFKNKNCYDITSEYLPHKTITIELKHTLDHPQFIFLGVLNGYNWKPVGFGKVQGDSVLFSDVGLDAIYAPLHYFQGGYYSSDEFLLAGKAFFLSASGIIQVLYPNKLHTVDVTFNLQRVPWLIPGRKYNVIYWNGVDWVADSSQYILKKNPRKPGSEKEEIIVKNLPSKTMYRIISDNLRNETDLGRPFIYNECDKVFKDY